MIKSVVVVMALLLVVMPAASCGPGEETIPTMTPTIAPSPSPTSILPHVSVPPLEPAFAIKIDNPYKEGGEECYKGAVHVHPDGDQPSKQIVEAYKDKEYDFIFLTAHNKIYPDQGVDGIMQFWAAEDGRSYRHHILAYGIDFTRVWQYHDTVRDDVDEEPNGIVNWDTDPCANVYRRIEYYEYVGMAILAHPHIGHDDDCSFPDCNGWTWDELSNNWTEDISAETKEPHNYTGIEIYNSSESADLSKAFCLDWWDQLLRMRKKVWGFGGDDCHNAHDNTKSFNRSWIVVRSNLPKDTDVSILQDDIIRNIQAGNFYTVVRSPEIEGDSSPSNGPMDYGPDIKISVQGTSIIVDTADTESTIRFVLGWDSEDGWFDEVVKSGTHAAFDITSVNEDRLVYVRVVVSQQRSDGENYRAYSQPLFVSIVPK